MPDLALNGLKEQDVKSCSMEPQQMRITHDFPYAFKVLLKAMRIRSSSTE
jgi:hypothetical protein